jgi:hypothetical protein
MFEDNVQVYVQSPDSEQRLIPGRLIMCKGLPTHIQFAEPIKLPIERDLQLYLHNKAGRFHNLPIAVTKMDAAGDRPVANIKVLGTPREQERRSEARLSVPDDMMVACIDHERSGSVLDVSSKGLSVLIDTDQKPLYSWIEIELKHRQYRLAGRMQVRSCRSAGEGFFRYGLMISEEAGDTLGKALQLIVQDIELASKKAAEQASAAGHGTNKRQHLRRVWPGPARVYIREESNLRVLKVNTMDLSEGGLSFTSAQPIYEGTEILFEKPADHASFCINATVRSVRLVEKARYRIGVQFKGQPLSMAQIPNEIAAMMRQSAA